MTWEFADLMLDSVVITRFSKYSTSGSGVPTYSGASTYQARVVAEPVLVKGTTGGDVVATHTMWLATTADVSPQDRCSFEGSTFQVIASGRYPDDMGRHHTRLRCRGGAR